MAAERERPHDLPPIAGTADRWVYRVLFGLIAAASIVAAVAFLALFAVAAR